MADGGEADAVAIVAAPGHVMPPNADPYTEQGFTAWVNTIHPKFVESGLADKLIEDGFDNVRVAAKLDVEALRSDFDVPRGLALQFIDAAQAVAEVLGYIRPVAVMKEAAREAREVKSTQAPKVPV